MDIPQTALEPFGIIGLPKLTGHMGNIVAFDRSLTLWLKEQYAHTISSRRLEWFTLAHDFVEATRCDYKDGLYYLRVYTPIHKIDGSNFDGVNYVINPLVDCKKP